MRRAFSKPTRSEAEMGDLVAGYRAAGYEGLQLKAGQYSPHLDDPSGFQQRWGGEAGTVSALIVFDVLDAAGQARLSAAVDFAAAVGSERVVFCHNHTREGVSTQDRRELADLLGRHGAAARERGVQMSLHHHYDQPVMTAQDVREFYSAVPADVLGLTVDTAHLAKSGVHDIPAFLAEFATVVDNIHLKDYAQGEWRLLGQGDLDLGSVVGQLQRQGYDGWLCADEESSASLQEGLAVSAQWLDAHLPLASSA